MSKEFIPAAKPIIGAEEREAVDAVLRTGMLAQGSVVAEFEHVFASQLGAGRETVAVNAGTSALLCGLLAAGIGAGDEVIVPSFTFAATANSVALTGAKPVFADIEAEHFCLDPAAVEAAVTPNTKAILPVHLYGHPANMTELGRIAREHDLMIFEDACQAHGATWNGQQVGTFGTFGAFSLYPTKNMTSGEGGMITSESSEHARKCRLYRNQGMEKQYQNEVIGFNLRMTNIHAAIGREQLKKVAGWTAKRQENAAFLSANLQGVTVPAIAPQASHVFHQYTIRVTADRDGFVQALREEYQIGSGVYYPIPNHRLGSLCHFAPGLDLPQTEAAAREVVSLPVHPSLDQEDLERIVTAVNALVKAGA